MGYERPHGRMLFLYPRRRWSAIEGDNAHLWFSSDARNAMAKELADIYSRIMPKQRKYFSARLKAWNKRELKLEKDMEKSSKSLKGISYASTEPVAYYLFSDIGLTDKTPEGYSQSTADGSQPSSENLQEFQKLLEDHGTDFLVNNTQETSDATNIITGTAHKSGLPVIDISEQMPSDCKDLIEWTTHLITTLDEEIAKEKDKATDGTDETGSDTQPSDAKSDSGSKSSSESTTDGTSPDNTGQTIRESESFTVSITGNSMKPPTKHTSSAVSFFAIRLRNSRKHAEHMLIENDCQHHLEQLLQQTTKERTMHDEAATCIEFKDAGVTRGGNTIWQHGTFRIPQGSVTAIVGTNGAGKTTMMKAELGLVPIAQGSITVLGQPAGTMNHRIGYVPQSYASDIESNITAEQSVMLGLTRSQFGIHPTTRRQKDKVRDALTFVGMRDKASYRLSELSGGLRQRVAIAQALVSDPQLLMLDEPLANLDLASQRATVHVLAKLNHELGMTIQVVAHDLKVLLPILTGAVYLLDGHPHYASMNEVLDSKLLTHLYGTTVQVVTTPQGDMFVTPSEDEPDDMTVDAHAPEEIAQFHHHNHETQEA